MRCASRKRGLRPPGSGTGRGHLVPALLRQKGPPGPDTDHGYGDKRGQKVTAARGHPFTRSPHGQTTSPIAQFSPKSTSPGLTLVRRAGPHPSQIGPPRRRLPRGLGSNQPARHREKVTKLGRTSKLLSFHFQTQKGIFMMTGMHAQAVALDPPRRGDSTP